MPNLKCHEYSCKSNHCSHCSMNSLNVSADAYCNDYRLRDLNESADVSYEYAYDQAMSLKQDDHHIFCNDHRCINNTSGQCTASYIRIDRKDNGAKCCQVRER